jgi:aminoglycoside/choline kinase family phosphotransferase
VVGWLGAVTAVEDRSWPHGVTRVYRATTATGTAFVKVHSQVRKFRQEVGAYRDWVPALAAAGVLVAELLGEDESLRVLVLSDLGGHPPDPTDPAVHAQAGAALAVLHGLPFVDGDAMPTRVAVLARLQRWAAEARGVVPDDVVARVVSEVGDASAFDGGRRVPCHRDFSPRNWMVRDGRFGLIDFEHAAPDIRWVDFSKLAEDAWRERRAKRAFVDAYGRPWSELDAARFRALMWLHALSTWVWSVTHRDPAYEAQARDLYARLAAGYHPLALD